MTTRLTNTQFNVLWKTYNLGSVVEGLPRDNIWHAPAVSIRSLVRLGYLKSVGTHTRKLTPKGENAMKVDHERWLVALEHRECRRREQARAASAKATA